MTRHLTRRSTLQLGTMAAACAALPFWAQNPQPGAGKRAATPDPKRARLSVATWPFRSRIDAPKNDSRDPKQPGLDLAAFAAFVQKEFSLSAIEPLDQHFPSETTAYMRQLRATLDKLGMRVANLPIDADVDLCSPDPETHQNALDVYRTWVDHAVVLGSPSIRIATPKCGGPQDTTRPAEVLAPVADYAKARGVMVHLENDDPVLSNATRVTAILRTADNPNLRALPDFGNGLMAGDSAFAVNEARLMFGFPGRIAHVKDAVQVDKERRTVPLAQIFTIARTARFTGTFSLESDQSADPIPDTHHLIEQALALM